MIVSLPAATRRPRRNRPGARDLPPREWERLLRERSYIRPLPAPVPLHVMARRREMAAPGERPGAAQ